MPRIGYKNLPACSGVNTGLGSCYAIMRAAGFTKERTMRLLEEMLQSDLLMRLALDDAGATAIEYGLIAALIAVAAIAAFQLVGTNLSSLFNSVATQL